MAGRLTACVTLILMMALAAHATAAEFGSAEITLNGQPAPAPSSPVCGLSIVAQGDGPQVAVTAKPATCTVVVRQGEEVVITLPLRGVQGPFVLAAWARLAGPQPAQAAVQEFLPSPLAGEGSGVRGQAGQITTSSLDGRQGPMVDVSLAIAGQAPAQASVGAGQSSPLQVSGQGDGKDIRVVLKTVGRGNDTAVCWREFSLQLGAAPASGVAPVWPAPVNYGAGAAPVLPPLRPGMEEALVEWDWRMQDGIDTERVPVSYAAATEKTLARGDALLADLQSAGVALGELKAQWEQVRHECEALTAAASGADAKWEVVWRRVHQLRRQIALANPLAHVGPLLFVKQVPGAFSHQLTQVYGRYARPGGGVFVLDAPGQSMRCRELTAGKLPLGSYQHPEVSYDGRRILFSYCQTDSSPQDVAGIHGRYYHLFEMSADGSGLRQLTEGAFDDFSPKYLPDGHIMLVSTRRHGWHRCGAPGCETYTLAVAEADGSNPRPVSYHETQEWDPSVLDDGRIIYTRWDYVDRHAVYYEQLWTTRPDGSSPAAFYGNNTFNPVGTWEARAVPGSHRVMATAAPHHGMTAGSIVLLDVTRGIDGPKPLTRLTPDALFPESETLLLPGWRSLGPAEPPPASPEADRWPGHCYKSPWPLSERYFLAAYSFDPLIGEPKGNNPNMFGIYLVDAFGNKELLYRDLNISSVWPMPLAPRPRPPVLAAVAQAQAREGTFFVADVYQSAPPLPAGSVKGLRIVQVLPKSTPCINNPPVGIPNASPGKQVLGTVPVEADGSAYFTAPAGLPLSFQALDDRGQAIQVMRSIVYLQPGENAACVGCHESRMTTPPAGGLALALGRPPSAIRPAPAGSKPLSYPILVQPVLDRLCVRCHSPEKPEGKVILTGQPEGHYTASYNALAPRVSFSAWGGKPGDFRQSNSEPLSQVDFFGARGSPLMKLLMAGHQQVQLGAEDMERLVTWMDANALFYGTFDPEGQARQQRGELIAGPGLE